VSAASGATTRREARSDLQKERRASDWDGCESGICDGSLTALHDRSQPGSESCSCSARGECIDPARAIAAKNWQRVGARRISPIVQSGQSRARRLERIAGANRTLSWVENRTDRGNWRCCDCRSRYSNSVFGSETRPDLRASSASGGESERKSLFDARFENVFG